MGSVLLAHQPAGEKRETGLHEEHKIPSEERPAKVRGYPHVPDGVCEFGRERLLGRLSLILIEVFFFFAKSGSFLSVGSETTKELPPASMTLDLSPVEIPAGSGFGSEAAAAAGAAGVAAGASTFAGSEPPGGVAASSAKHKVAKRTIPSRVKRLKHRRLDFPRFIFPPLLFVANP